MTSALTLALLAINAISATYIVRVYLHQRRGAR